MPSMRMLRLGLLLVFLVGMGSIAYAAPARSRAADEDHVRALCDDNAPLCAEAMDSIGYEGQYTGHDEPSLLFYSNTPGSGTNQQYRLVIPKDPPTLPTQDGTGGTFNFQNRIAFWLGLDLCDNQSAPEFTHAPCAPGSDTNIFDGADPAKPDYIGRQPGTAFLELQFYLPGWAPFVEAINDLTTGQSGSMTASVANGFAQINYEPTATTCSQTPYAFHPMYSTSSEHTRVPWAAHSYNVAYSDEIGVFEYCADV